jgi:hypothetical protein
MEASLLCFQVIVVGAVFTPSEASLDYVLVPDGGLTASLRAGLQNG